MAKKHVSVAVPASVSTGAASFIGDMTSVQFALTGTFDATYQVQICVDGSGTAFANFGSAFADAGGTLAIPDAATHIRVDCPADYTSGTPAGACGGVTTSQYSS